MADYDWKSDVQEPAASGRDAFWAGKPVWANPYVGAAARSWKSGWVSGQAELVQRAGDPALSASDGERKRLLLAYRPEDITPRPAPRRSRTREQSAAAADFAYSVAAAAEDEYIPNA
jgi:hypothetical protein